MRNQRQEWIDFLEANEYFVDITLLPENKKNIVNEITRALGPLNEKGGKTGIVVIFLTVTAGPAQDGGNGPVLDLLHVARVLENPTINTTAKDYESVAEKIATLSHGNFTPITGNSPFVLEAPGITLGNDPKLPSKDVFFRCAGHIGVELEQAATPTADVDAGEMTVSCATLGAAIFYTVNSTAPSPRNGTLYTAPIAVEPGQTIKARAWLAGYLASEVLKVIV